MSLNTYGIQMSEIKQNKMVFEVLFMKRTIYM